MLITFPLRRKFSPASSRARALPRPSAGRVERIVSTSWRGAATPTQGRRGAGAESVRAVVLGIELFHSLWE
jgi:hypothetical protein